MIDKLITILQFIKDRRNKDLLADHSHANPNLFKEVSMLFELRDLISRQKALLTILAEQVVKNQLYKAIVNLQSRRSEESRLYSSYSPYQPVRKETNAVQGSSTSGECKGKRLTWIRVAPLSHWGSSGPSSIPMTMTTTRPTTDPMPIIDLVSPPLELDPTIRQHLRPLLSLYPAHMKKEKCFNCRRMGHFGSYCLKFVCYICKKPAPWHYPSNCPSRTSQSPAPPSYCDWENDDQYDDRHYEFDDDTVANMTREPSGLWKGSGQTASQPSCSPQSKSSSSSLTSSSA